MCSFHDLYSCQRPFKAASGDMTVWAMKDDMTSLVTMDAQHSD